VLGSCVVETCAFVAHSPLLGDDAQMGTTTLAPPIRDDVPASPRGKFIWAIVASVALVAAFGLGLLVGRDTSVHRYTYTGTVVAVCSHPLGGTPSCFALTPDPGTAHGDGYYAGRGDVSFGPPPEGFSPEVGDHVTVSVVSVVDAGPAVVEVTPT